MLLVTCLAYSCAEKIDNPVDVDHESETGLKTCSMFFEGDVVGFSNGDSKVATKTTKSTWNDGEMIYITFIKDNSAVACGTATYSSTRGWSVTYEGTLSEGTDLRCYVHYFVNAPYSNQNYVTMDPYTESYVTYGGTYDYDGSKLIVKASLSPSTGRIRFSGTPGDEIYVYGLNTYTKYQNPIEGSYGGRSTGTKSIVKLKVGADGYTSYIYAGFADTSRNLGVVGSDFAYTKTCSDEVLKVGESGYMTIPSEEYCNGWKRNLIVTVAGVEFTMIAVPGHSDGFFLIGETEVTNELYSVVVDGKATTTNPQIPVSYKTYDEFLSFVTKLSSRAELKFEIPTKPQWQYAAKGGLKSQGYTYSGSNTQDHVAWYSGNSNGYIHDVKQKSPNELGIYDMSGNVWEFTCSKYSSNTKYSYYYCGGSYATEFCKSGVSSYDNTDNPYRYYYVGLRLLLTIE